MAQDLGAEYMELVAARLPRRSASGDVQLVLAPGNSANYEAESLRLRPRDPTRATRRSGCTSSGCRWSCTRPGIVGRGDSEERVSLADIAPTMAELIGFEAWPADREGSALPLPRTR